MNITEETRQRLIKFLYQEYDKDTTCVEVNELLDILEGRLKEYNHEDV